MLADEEIVDKYIRTHKRPFTFEMMYRTISEKLQDMSEEECASYLMSSCYVFSGGGAFITHAGAFTGSFFSIKPSRAEVEQGILVAGGRCVPFVDGAMPSYMLSFRYEGKKLSKKEGEFTSAEAADMFAMYDREFAPQYVAQDIANCGMDIAAEDYRLPPKVHLTGVELPLEMGDRVICFVSNWDKGVITIERIEHHDALEISESDIKRQEWYDILERELLKCFDMNGPRGSIDEQLALTFMNNLDELCIEECGSVAEYLQKSRKISYASYGVETRLWRTGEEVPVAGEWNKGEDGMYRGVLSGFILGQDYVINAILTDQVRRESADDDKVLDVLLPPFAQLTHDDKEFLKANIKAMRETIAQAYNPFADADVAPLRSRMLELYGEARELMCEMYAADVPLIKYSQQALVVFLQIFSNILKTLSMIQTELDITPHIIEETGRALDNMESDAGRAMCMLSGTLEEEKTDCDLVLVR